MLQKKAREFFSVCLETSFLFAFVSHAEVSFPLKHVGWKLALSLTKVMAKITAIYRLFLHSCVLELYTWMMNASKISSAEFQSNLRVRKHSRHSFWDEGKWMTNMKLWGHKKRKDIAVDTSAICLLTSSYLQYQKNTNFPVSFPSWHVENSHRGHSNTDQSNQLCRQEKTSEVEITPGVTLLTSEILQFCILVEKIEVIELFSVWRVRIEKK